MEKLDGVLADLAAKLGTTVEQLAPELVKYYGAVAQVELTLGLVLLSVGLPLSALGWWLVSKFDGYGQEGRWVFSMILGVASGVAALFGLVNSITGLHNTLVFQAAPQAYTAMKIIEAMGK